MSAVQWRSPAAEAYRILRTNVLWAASAVDVKFFVVTSAYSGEGKSATVANLGVVLARAGKNVTLVSADLRRPRLHEFFNREEHMGLIDLLAGRTTLRQALQEVAVPTHGFDNAMASLRLLSSGNVAEDRGASLVDDHGWGPGGARELSDIVLIDVPPVLPITDALVVAEVTKHVLLVISPEASTRPAITSARQQLDRVGARILGGVLNGPDPSCRGRCTRTSALTLHGSRKRAYGRLTRQHHHPRTQAGGDDGRLPRIDNKADVSIDRAHRGGWRIYEWELDLLREYRASYPLRLRKRARKRHVRSHQ